VEQVILEFVADTQGLKKAADSLLALGLISKEQHAQFVKANQESEKQLKARAFFEKEIQKATQQATNDAKKMNDAFRQMIATIAWEVIKEIVQTFQELGRETEDLTKKFNSAKQELKELTAQINNGELEGEALTKAKLRAAELTDQIGDTRDEIRALASDTRTFDLMVEGVRGITAAMSLAQGATALFGEENEDVQKALLKVQAAMAVATATQELATIATTKGGIAATAYGYAVKAVEAIQKQFAISSAAAWATATAGLTVLIGGVIALAAYFRDAKDESEALAKAEKDRQAKFSEGIKGQVAALDEMEKRQENERKLAQIRGEDLIKLEKRQLNERLALILELQHLIKYNRDTNAIDEASYKELSTRLETERLDTLLSLRKDASKKSVEIKKEQREKEAEVDNIEAFRLPDKPKVEKEVTELARTVEDVVMEKVPTVDLPVNIQPMDAEDIATQLDLEFKKAAPIINDFANTINSVFGSISELASAQTAARIDELNTQREAELSNKNLTEEQKEAIDKKYRDKENAIKRKAAEQEKALKLFMATVNTAVGITNAFTSGDPYTAPLRAALAAASGLAQVAVIAAQPIPAFEKGGKNIPEGMALVGEKGPELMWIPQGASIIPNTETRQILDKWGVPAMPALPGYAGDSLLNTNNVGIDYERLGEVISEKLRRNPHLSINIDKKGFSTHILSKSKSVEYVNNKYQY
jgi:nucleotide-binding universal stress UspA family protein